MLFVGYVTTSGTLSSFVDVYHKWEDTVFNQRFEVDPIVSSHRKVKMACAKPFDEDNKIFMKVLGVKVDGKFYLGEPAFQDKISEHVDFHVLCLDGLVSAWMKSLS